MSVWMAIGGLTKAREVEVKGADASLAELRVDKFAAMGAQAAAAHPVLKATAATMRTVRSASVNDWGAIAWSTATGVGRAADADANGRETSNVRTPRADSPTECGRSRSSSPFYLATVAYCTSSSTQSKVLVTAFFQRRYWRSRSALSMDGIQRLSSAQLSMTSCSPVQKPTAMPAA